GGNRIRQLKGTGARPAPLHSSHRAAGAGLWIIQISETDANVTISPSATNAHNESNPFLPLGELDERGDRHDSDHDSADPSRPRRRGDTREAHHPWRDEQ